MTIPTRPMRWPLTLMLVATALPAAADECVDECDDYYLACELWSLQEFQRATATIGRDEAWVMWLRNRRACFGNAKQCHWQCRFNPLQRRRSAWNALDQASRRWAMSAQADGIGAARGPRSRPTRDALFDRITEHFNGPVRPLGRLTSEQRHEADGWCVEMEAFKAAPILFEQGPPAPPAFLVGGWLPTRLPELPSVVAP